MIGSVSVKNFFAKHSNAKLLLACFLIIGSLLVIYSNSFQGTWVYDDFQNIVENSNVQPETLDWSNLKRSFYGTYEPGTSFRRPLAYLTFALNYYFNGLAPFGYHLVNLLIHCLTAITLFFLLLNTLQLPVLEERYHKTSYIIALLTTLFWAMHPVQVTAVTFIVQRMTAMAALFYLLSMLFYLKARTATASTKQKLFIGVCGLTALLAFASKENSFILPVILIIFDLILVEGISRKSIIWHGTLLLAVIMLLFVFGVWKYNLQSLFASTYELRPFTLGERLLTEPRVFFRYITLLLYPIEYRLTLLHDVTISTSLLSPWTTLPAIIGTGFFFSAGIWLGKRKPLLSFCMLFFLLNHLIEGSIFPLELMYEHRNYLPSAFFFLPIVLFMLWARNYFSYKNSLNWLTSITISLLLVFLADSAITRNNSFRSEYAFWFDCVAKSPERSDTLSGLGDVFMKHDNPEMAAGMYDQALKFNNFANRSKQSIVHENLGMYYLKLNDSKTALEHFQKARHALPNQYTRWQTCYGFAVSLYKLDDIAQAEKYIDIALINVPEAEAQDVLFLKSLISYKRGAYTDAISLARQTRARFPEFEKPLLVLGAAYLKNGNYPESIETWQAYQQKKPDHIRTNLALLELAEKTNNVDLLLKQQRDLSVLMGNKTIQEFFDQLDDSRETIITYIPDPSYIQKILQQD